MNIKSLGAVPLLLITPSDYVLNSNISMVTSLDVSNQNIIDLTGIESFYSLEYLYCYSNQLTSIDITQNIFLEESHQ